MRHHTLRRALRENLHVATRLTIDRDLLEKALALSGEKTGAAAVTLALREFVARREKKRLRELFGKLQWDGSYDYKQDRSRP